MRRTLIVLAVLNVFVSLGLVFWVSMTRGFSAMFVMDQACNMEKAGAVDYDKLGVMLGKNGPADRYDLEQVMGIDQTRQYGSIATALLLLTVVQTGAVVSCALCIRGDRRPSPPDPAPSGGDVPQR